METMRKPFQGVWNIIRFNWHFFVLSTGFLVLIATAPLWLGEEYQVYAAILFCLVLAPIVVSLAVSYYVYDLSNLYQLTWLNSLKINPKSKIVNINAGFDETSALLQHRYPNAELAVLDFYDPAKHTEVSIQRARKAYPPYPGTQTVTTAQLPFDNQSIDTAFLILAAHEIRDDEERTAFFKELGRVLKPTGQVVVVEHLRDWPNFLAYTIGFLHFHSKNTWQKNFRESHFNIQKEIKITPFISCFILEKPETS